ncbi:MAG: transposase [Eubacteriales bacterium]
MNLLKTIRTIQQEVDGIYSYRQMQSHLKLHNNITKGEYIIRKLMKEHHLQSKVRRKKPKYIK